MKDWEKGSGYVKEPKVTVGPGISKDGSATGGVEIEVTNPQESQTVNVRGTKRIRPDKKPVKACLLYTSPSPRDRTRSRMPSSA